MAKDPTKAVMAIGAVVVLAAAGCGDNDDSAVTRMNPMSIPKYEAALTIPQVMPPSANGAVVEYQVAVRRFEQQILPRPMPRTPVFGYGSVEDPATFSYPGFTFETRSNVPVRVTWRNELVDDDGDFLPPLVPVDATLHWADPGGSHGGHHGELIDDARYTGPVPTITHVHGAHSFDHSDGHPEAWFLPAADNIPADFARQGPTYRTQADVGDGAAVFDYPQDENAATLWYHDHTLGMTRLNIYSGLAGFWLIRDDQEDSLNLPGPAPRLGDPPGTPYYEIPLVVQDKSFADGGALYYSSSRTEYDGYAGPFIPDSPVPPIWGPEFFGDAIVVNGQTWPFFEVEPRLYRFRILNAADARTFIFGFDRPLEIVQIGGDGGLLPEPVRLDQLLLGPAERADVLIDFSGFAPGETITMTNVGPDEPWGGPDAMQDPANPDTTGQIMQFRIVPLSDAGQAGAVPTTLPAIEPLVATVPPRDLLLAELAVSQGGDDFPYHVQLGTVALGPLPWEAPATEVIKLDSTEIWRVANTTEDAHPIHLHLIEFQVLDRIPFDVDAFQAAQDAWLGGTGPEPVLDDFITGPAMPPVANERGPKDTVLMHPGTITRIIAHYDRVGSYVWHCHIVEHEDNDMMRPLEIVP